MRESIFDPLYLSALDCDYIIAHSCIGAHLMPVSVIIRNLAYLPLLMQVHRCGGIALCCCAAVFHFHKDQITLMITYNIDLSLPAAEILLHYPHSLRLQVIRRGSLPL